MGTILYVGRRFDDDTLRNLREIPGLKFKPVVRIEDAFREIREGSYCGVVFGALCIPSRYSTNVCSINITTLVRKIKEKGLPIVARQDQSDPTKRASPLELGLNVLFSPETDFEAINYLLIEYLDKISQ